MKLGTTSLSVTQPGNKGKKIGPPLVYDLTANTSVDEGATLVCNVSVNLPSGDGTLYWDIAHNTSNSSDFTAVSGTVSVTNQSGSFNISAVADNTTEGSETFDINLRTGSNSGPIVSTVVGVTINDTSITPVTKFYYWRAHDYGSHQHSMAMVVHDVTNGTSHAMLTYTTNSNSWVSKSVNIAQFSGHVVYFAHCKQKSTYSQYFQNDSAVDQMYVDDNGTITTYYPTSTGGGWKHTGNSDYSTATVAAHLIISSNNNINTSNTYEQWCVGSNATPSSGTGPSSAYLGTYYYFYEASTTTHSSANYGRWTAMKTSSSYTVS